MDREDSYRLLDCGDQRRLEKFGHLIIDRPAPGALFPRARKMEIWNQAQARYVRSDKGSFWQFSKGIEPEPFEVEIEGIRFQIRFSENGQLGVYPEQLGNWCWLQKYCALSSEPLRILNGFAYTGGSTMAASLGGKEGISCDLCHLDSSKSSVNWARENRRINGLEKETIRFIVEDMLTFMEREIRRENKYQGIILDPPAFGRAAGGKTWEIKRDLPVLLKKSKELLDSKARFFLLSCHDKDTGAEDLKQMLQDLKLPKGQLEKRELVIPSLEGNALPNGCSALWIRD